MARKPTHEELEQRIKELEEESDKGKRERDALRESEGKYRILLDESADAVFSFASDGRYLYVNRAFAEGVGRPLEQIIDRKIWDVFPKDEADKRFAALSEVFQTGEGKVIEVRVPRPDGDRFYITTITPIKDKQGQVHTVICSSKNITEHKRAEEALRESEERYRNLYDQAPVGYMELDSQGRIAMVNRKELEILGYEAEEMLGRHVWDFVVEKEAQEVIKAKLAGVLRPPVKGFERTYKRKDGTNVPVLIADMIVRDYEGRITGIRSTIEDITERRRMEEALRESEALFRNLFEHHAAVKLIIDPDTGNIIDANAAAAEFYGWTQEQLKQMKIQDINTLSSQELRQEMEKARSHERIHFEFRHRRADGSIRDVDVFSSKIEAKGKELLHSIIHDITERKRAEEALRESMNTMKSIFRAAPVGIGMVIDRVILQANDKLCEMTGYSREELLGKSARVLYPTQEEYERVGTEKYDQIHLRGTGSIETKWLRKDGVVIDVLLSSSALVPSDLPMGVTFTALDVTERKRMEESLRESEERYRNILESIEEGYYEVDIAGNLTFINDSVCELLGYSRDELIGMNSRLYTDAQSAETLYRAYNEVYRTGKPTKGFDWEVIRKDGTKRFVEASVTLMKDAEGIPLGFRGIARDVTNRKRAEEEKQRLETQLQQAQKMEAIGTLAGGIAHDFNNLLMGIQGRASLMLADMDSSNPHSEHLRGVEEYVRSAADLTRQLLGFARGGKYEVKATDLNELMNRSASLFGRTKKEITIHRKFQPGLWTVEVDRGQVEQVLLNLFVNAWQAMPAGGEIYLQTQNVVLDETYVKPHGMKSGEYVKISVTDTGMGMDEQTKQRLFDPFFTTKGMGRGTGLGLASAYGIIKNHDGIITVYSEKGHGSSFNIYLPASGKGVSVEKPPPGDLVKGEGTILLVDDEEMILEVGKPMLERLGYEVLVARSGKEAIGVYQGNMGLIKVVILDMIMPQMGGGETFDQLKAINPQVKVLLSSGYSINGQAQEILNRGCHGFIQKPFHLRELSQRLAETLYDRRVS